jgi:hypothetical protein
MASDVVIKPQEDLALLELRRRMRGIDSGIRYERDRAVCHRCKSPKFWRGGSLILDLKYQGLRGVTGIKGNPMPLKIMLSELPKSGEVKSWGHAFAVSFQDSERTRSIQYAPVSVCPSCSTSSGPLDSLKATHVYLTKRRPSEEERLSPRVCCDCKLVTREGLRFDCSVKEPDGCSMAIIQLIEMDPHGYDFHPKPLYRHEVAEHWCFHGVLDAKRGVTESNYNWTLTCPPCTARRLKGIATAPDMPIR